MELRQLQYFLKVAQKEHVTQAAEELHVAQSAVSRQIHQLEEELGVHLFMQKGRNLQLTPVGQLFCKRVEGILKDLDKAVMEVHEFLDPEQGEIRIGFPHSLGIHLIPSVVAEFKRRYPNVKFRFKQGMFPSLIRDVISAEVDLAFISPFPEKHEHVEGEVILTEELYAILPPNHPLAEKESIKLVELKDEKFVLFSKGYSLRPIVWHACLEAGFTPKIAFEGEETDTIRGLVAAGMGVSILPELALFQTNPLQPARVKISEPKVTRTIGLIHRSDDKLPLVAQSFRTFLLKYFGLHQNNKNTPVG
ncbi:LysR family transcriptional regulator [Paenibacillus cellulositrophicus]|uniref:LysR family transcriptional activator of glutamate synthase operon n=3 Tax=Paenibacillus TaxID=44249 RepID=A0A1R1ERC8_9BACL|nr:MULTISPECIES: LysR family transcriptional regulator [Paenibacillus]MBB3128884.1 LysR family transcriptional activator of glutamate synthase operon [Paenibacillus rhizosphaerae]MBJ9989103.1 LysR family transcriptional regulator [Paenibacillus sp. S28]MCM2996786.1 LysR family transcriptional regulator [Paenibacillus cellulositrophicus]MEC0177972.1 LysR family transcriptional regulator [Paenibacillus favisporus]OMF54329.1 LysR family transcriptional regulator [Paenibacillus rhizosphaerae]